MSNTTGSTYGATYAYLSGAPKGVHDAQSLVFDVVFSVLLLVFFVFSVFTVTLLVHFGLMILNASLDTFTYILYPFMKLIFLVLNMKDKLPTWTKI